jgi:hypothetical protein
MSITHTDLFYQLYDDIKSGISINEICKSYGGGNLYIPSYKRTFRNNHIINDYQNKLQSGKTKARIIKQISQEYDLTPAAIYKILSNQKKEIK